MKLTLNLERGISILTVYGTLNEKDHSVLAAGIRKLLRDGKNRILLELPEVEKLKPEALRVIAQLNLAAAELAGQIVISGVDAKTRDTILSFSTPPVMRCFLSRAEAFDFFFPPEKAEIESVPAASAPPVAPAVPGPLKEEIRARELGEIGEVRKKLALAEKENLELNRLLLERIYRSREPDTTERSSEKIRLLEAELREMKKTLDEKK